MTTPNTSALIARLIESYGATTCQLSATDFKAVQASASREGVTTSGEGFDVASEGETYHFHAVELTRSRQRGGGSVSYRMEQH